MTGGNNNIYTKHYRNSQLYCCIMTKTRKRHGLFFFFPRCFVIWTVVGGNKLSTLPTIYRKKWIITIPPQKNKQQHRKRKIIMFAYQYQRKATPRWQQQRTNCQPSAMIVSTIRWCWASSHRSTYPWLTVVGEQSCIPQNRKLKGISVGKPPLMLKKENKKKVIVILLATGNAHFYKTMLS